MSDDARFITFQIPDPQYAANDAETVAAFEIRDRANCSRYWAQRLRWLRKRGRA